MVCTVLTGIREIAILENICPPTWNSPIGNVSFKIALVGLLSLVSLTAGLANSKQNAATKPNWTIVNVMGYLNWVRMAFPVFDDIAEDMYHSEQSMQKRIILGAPADEEMRVRRRGASKKWNNFDNEDQSSDVEAYLHALSWFGGAQPAGQLGPCLRLSSKTVDVMPLCLSSTFP